MVKTRDCRFGPDTTQIIIIYDIIVKAKDRGYCAARIRSEGRQRSPRERNCPRRILRIKFLLFRPF